MKRAIFSACNFPSHDPSRVPCLLQIWYFFYDWLFLLHASDRICDKICSAIDIDGDGWLESDYIYIFYNSFPPPHFHVETNNEHENVLISWRFFSSHQKIIPTE